MTFSTNSSLQALASGRGGATLKIGHANLSKLEILSGIFWPKEPLKQLIKSYKKISNNIIYTYIYIFPESPKNKFCHLVVGNPLHGSS